MDKKTRAQELGNEILDFVNVYGCDAEAFAETISRGHRTLQQSTMRLFMAAIRKMAQGSSDDRNADTVELAKRIVEIADDYPLPLI